MKDRLAWLTMPVALVLMTALAFVTVVGVGLPVWLVATGRAPPALLVAPVTAILSTVAGSAVAYMRGLMRMPPAPEGTEFKLVPSMLPGPTQDDLEGFPAVAVSVDDVGHSLLPPTAPATPDSKRGHR